MTYRFLISKDGERYRAKFLDDNEVLFTSESFPDKMAARRAAHTLQSYAAPAEIKDEE
ncbi:MAG: hypothetical protein ABR588_03350 [Sphingomicrobium sp.]|nr:YegP family protein [Sphingomonadales bacterium]